MPSDASGTACCAPVIERAIEVFARGFSFVSSFTHPYVAEPVELGTAAAGGTLWVMGDAPRTRGSYRVTEWVCCNLAPQLVHDTILARADRARP